MVVRNSLAETPRFGGIFHEDGTPKSALYYSTVLMYAWMPEWSAQYIYEELDHRPVTPPVTPPYQHTVRTTGKPAMLRGSGKIL